MKKEKIQVGMNVRYTPVIGGDHDGEIYIVQSEPLESCGSTVCFLHGKRGFVDINAIFPYSRREDKKGAGG